MGRKKKGGMKMYNQIVEWPEVFKAGKINYPKTWEGRGAACADGLSAWALCHAKNTPPENFGSVLILIGAFLGISPIQESLSEYAEKWHKEKEN